MTLPKPDWIAVCQVLNSENYGQKLLGGPVTCLLGTSINGYDHENKHMSLGFNLGSAFVNDNDIIMGGIISTALDLSMALNVMAQIDEEMGVATTNLQIQFFRACQPGRQKVKSRIVKLGKRIAYCEAQMFDQTNSLVAAATNTNQLVKRFKADTAHADALDQQ